MTDIIKHSLEEQKIPEFLKIDEEKTIKRRRITKDLLLHRTTILYGSPASGKSYVIKLCLNEIQHDVPVVYVISATGKQNHAYDGVAHLIITKPTINLISEILDAQRVRVGMYNDVSSVDNLKNLYNYCKTIDSRKVIYNECIKFESEIKDIVQKTETKFKLLPADKVESLRRERETYIISRYRNFFNLFRGVILTNYKNIINPEYFMWLTHININPNTAIIFDDCVPFIQELNEKRNHKFTQDMLFTSRHLRLTIIVASQMGKAFGPSFRASLHNTIFCDAPIAMQYSDEIKEKTIKKEFLAMVNKIFTSTTTNEMQLKTTNVGAVKNKNPTKFIYQVDGNSENKFTFLYEVTPESELKIKLGGASVNNFCINLEKKTSAIALESKRQYYESIKQNIL
jgi:hypothetical protein